jgi:hypothetical protein
MKLYITDRLHISRPNVYDIDYIVFVFFVVDYKNCIDNSIVDPYYTRRLKCFFYNIVRYLIFLKLFYINYTEFIFKLNLSSFLG